MNSTHSPPHNREPTELTDCRYCCSAKALITKDLTKRGVEAYEVEHTVWPAVRRHVMALSDWTDDPEAAHEAIVRNTTNRIWKAIATRVAMAFQLLDPVVPPLFDGQDVEQTAETMEVAYHLIADTRTLLVANKQFGGLKSARCHHEQQVVERVETAMKSLQRNVIALLVDLALTLDRDCTLPALQPSAEAQGLTEHAVAVKALTAATRTAEGDKNPEAVRALTHLAGGASLRVLGWSSQLSKWAWSVYIEPIRQVLLGGKHDAVTSDTIRNSRSEGRRILREAYHLPGCSCRLTY